MPAGCFTPPKLKKARVWTGPAARPLPSDDARVGAEVARRSAAPPRNAARPSEAEEESAKAIVVPGFVRGEGGGPVLRAGARVGVRRAAVAREASF